MRNLQKTALRAGLLAFVLAPILTLEAQVVNAKDLGLKEGMDATPVIRLALEECIARKAGKLVIPKGTYLLYPDRAVEKYVHISNNDDGLKRIAFPLHGLTDFEVDANGALFIMHGEMVTLAVRPHEEFTPRNEDGLIHANRVFTVDLIQRREFSGTTSQCG